MRAFFGILTPTALSTALTEDRACVYVQTPQERCTKWWASRGSLPCRIISIPRNIWPELQALTTLPPATSTSIRRCPSILVIGSIVIRCAIWFLPFCLDSYARLEFFVKRREIIPKFRLAAADAGMTGLNRPAGAVIKFGHRAVVVGLRTSTTHFV